MKEAPQLVVPVRDARRLGEGTVVAAGRIPSTGGDVEQATHDVLHHDVEVGLPLAVAQRRMHLGRLGVDHPGLDDLPVAGEQRVGERAVAPVDAVAVQVDEE